MNEPFDPFEVLRELNPVDPADLRGAATSPQARLALEQILDGTRKSVPTRRRWARRRPRLRTWRRSYLLVLIPVAAGLAAAAWALTHGPTKQLTIGCYASANLDARTVVVAAGAAPPLATCQQAWQRGDFGPPPSPRLEACILPSGAVGVFPSPNGQACQRLKLAPLTPTAPATSTAPRPRSTVTALKDALVQAFLARPCMTQTEATTAVRAELRRLQLTDWKVEARGHFTAVRSCASLAFDEEQHLILLIPIPKRP